MSYIALYRKWRPDNFNDVVEQNSVVSILKNSVKNNRIAHAYLFCGTRGTGKTTIAKIFAKAINCLNPVDGNPCNECDVCKGISSGSILDVIEIDAASNTGVDNVRDIIEEINYVPVQTRYKVYIIDEVHMLSIGAFNALLKTLEEPPEHVVFLLATTDPNKLPATILSRCQRFEFKRISIESIIERLNLICQESEIKADEEAVRYIAQAADGGLRDAISILDQCISAGKEILTLDEVLGILGIVNQSFVAEAAECIVKGDVAKTLDCIDIFIAEGKEITEFINELIKFFRNVLVLTVTDKKGITVTAEIKDKMLEISRKTSVSELIFFIKELSVIDKDIKWASQKKILLEVGMIRLCTRTSQASSSSLEERLALLETKLSEGSFIASAKSPAQSSGNKQAQAKAPEKPAAEKAKEAPAPMPGGRAVDPADVRDVLDELKSGEFMNMKVLSYVMNVRAEYKNNKIIAIIFAGAGKKAKKQFMSDKENMDCLTGAFNKVLGDSFTLKLYTDDEIQSDNPGDNLEGMDVLDRISGLKDDGITIKVE